MIIEQTLIITTNSSYLGKWNNNNSKNVSSVVGFVCEYDNTIDASKYIPAYKENYNGHEYWFFEDIVDWRTAKKICEAKGGYLTIPNNADENEFILLGVKKTSKTQTWIGATDIAEEGIWRDSKGDLLKYTNWHPAQPDNWNGSVEEDYALMWPEGVWNDSNSYAGFSDDIGFVCEFDDLCTGFGHSYTTEIIDPTCTEQGYTLHTCSKCGDSYKDTYTDKLNHEYGEWTITGDKAVHKCKHCDAEETKPLAASITLDRTSVSIEKGKTLTMKAVVAPDNAYSKDISWTSNYNSVAEVKNGVITAKSPGTTAIIASTSNGKIAVCMVTVTEAATNTVKNTSVINSDKVQIGDKVRVSASANGGTAPYTYAYYYKRSTNTAWKTLGTEWGTNSSVAFAPTAEASYDIKVVVKDSAGNKAEKLFIVNAVKELELTNVSVVGRENIKLGTAIPMIGKAVGGSAPYTYSFYFKRSTNTNWKLLGDKFTDKSSARFKPTAKGTYDIRIDVKDSSGTIDKKFFTATVK